MNGRDVTELLGPSEGISFTVHGIPAPQGSKTPWGTEANPNTRPWRAAVAAAAAQAADRLITGPVCLSVDFYFPRPKSHYRASGEVKPSAPDVKASKPDADKLLRAVGDALTGTVLRDDALIVWAGVGKWYGEPARADIRIVPYEAAA